MLTTLRFSASTPHKTPLVICFNGALKELFTLYINNRLTPHPGKCEVLLPFKTRLMGPLPAIYIGESIIEYKTKTRFLGVTVNQNLSWVPHLQDVDKSFANVF